MNMAHGSTAHGFESLASTDLEYCSIIDGNYCNGAISLSSTVKIYFLQYLKVLQHPNVLKFHALSHSSKEAWLVTEHVTPLETLLESLTADEILTGLSDVIEALSFLHDRVRL